MEGKRWWLIGVAAVLAVLTLVDSIGLMAGVALASVCVAGLVAYRFYRAKNPVKGPSVSCLRCGQSLSLTATQCKYCGSASWTRR